MKRVYLFCDNGMSTSMMAQRMQDVADSHNLPIECKAFSYKIIQDIIEKNTLDCILIGPQTKFLFDEINKKYGDKTPVMVIDPTDYGMMDAEKVLKAFVDVVTEEMKKGEKVQLVGFGTFEVSERAAREGRNPQTGKTMKIEACKAPKFKAGKALKDAVNA